MIFFTADEHYGHKNIIKYCNRPFDNVLEMNERIIANHNKVVGCNDTVFHLGDVSMKTPHSLVVERYLQHLNGKEHYYIKGSHDKWLKFPYEVIMEIRECKQFIVLCHYAMRVWPRSHYNSWQLYGHSHGRLPGVGKQYDVGVDNNNFSPVSFDEIKAIMEKLPDNFNLVKK